MSFCLEILKLQLLKGLVFQRPRPETQHMPIGIFNAHLQGMRVIGRREDNLGPFLPELLI